MHALAPVYEDDSDPPAASVVAMQRSYDRYYSTGLYARRYPSANPHMLRLILGELGPEGGRVLDFGCGSGRYALPLAQHRGVSVVGYDISSVAIEDLAHNRDALGLAIGRALPLELVCGSFADLERRLDRDRGFDLVTLLFGVLGHIPQRKERVAVLRSLRTRLKPGGKLIVTVPNRARRFPAEQEAARDLVVRGALEPGDIRYQRCGEGEPIELYYHLYAPADFRAELADAGFHVPRLRPESVLSERAVLASSIGAAADAVLRRLTPVSLAYGFVAVAEAALSPAA